jgi:ataxia telangiectasia mutated family protein
MHVVPLDIVNLLRAAYGVSNFVLSGNPEVTGGPIGETWSLLQERASIVRYLLLLEDPDSVLSQRKVQQGPAAHSITQMVQTSDSHAIRKLVAELLHPKLEELQVLCESWNKRGEGSSQISSEKLRSLLCCLVVVAFNLPHMTEVNSRQSQDLDITLFKLLKSALRVAADAPESQSLYNGVLKIVHPYLPSFSTSGLTSLTKDVPQLFELFYELSDIFRDRVYQQASASRDDVMDLDDEFESQQSHSSTVSKVMEFARRETPILDEDSFHSDTIQRLHLLKVLHQEPGQVGLVPPAFLDNLLELSDEEFLSCRHLNQELFARDLIINPDEAMRVIERLGAIIGSSTFSSCEVALNACLDVIEGFISIWTDERSELYSIVGQLYQYFIESALPNNLLSPKVRIALSRLLLRLTEINDKYPLHLKLPTTIKSLLSILQHSAIQVKFFVGENMSRVFGRFVLKMHDQVCMDVIDNLPKEAESSEGIALRLFVLSKLAQEWPTLLRRCVYHIFETPGIIHHSTKHATYCLRTIAKSLKLRNAQELFDLFSPQMLYTWLDGDSIETIPFEIFGFPDLDSLLQRARSEAAALMIMRGQATALEGLAKLLNLTPVQLVQSCFSKALSYSIAHDISIPKSDQHTSGEGRIRKIMGREPFMENVYINFADIIGTFFTLIDQEDPIEKSWAKDESLTYAAEAMANIKKCGQSEVELVANQQPQFRAKYLTREMALLCGRTHHEMATLWTPALVVAIARRLFNMIHPALGSLHACSVIRKVRVLICLAGSHAWQLYAVEMLLHSIRQYLVDPECADDALGMSQYLLTHGSSALAQSPSFLAGYALSTLASLRVFLESSQASTTQESQFKATMNKAQRFHTWLSKYLEEYQSPVLKDERQLAAFKAITQSAAHVRSSGNADRGTHESNLLLEILRDEGSGIQLLNEPSRNLALEILSKDFRIPGSFRNDAVSSDAEAVDLATAVWKSSRIQSHSNKYLVWAGRVIGRSFAASGDIDPSLLRESKLTQHLKSSSGGSSSEQGLLALMQSLASDTDCFTAGLAESALRRIISEAVAQEDNALLAACQKSLSEQLFITSDWNPYKTPPSDEAPVDQVPESLAWSAEALEDPRWPQRLTVHLTQSLSDHIVLGALPQVLTHVKDFAEAAFPFIIHLVLLSERDTQQAAKRSLSLALKDWLKLGASGVKDNMGLLINALLYLRTQKLPGENSIADRSQWLDVDPSTASAAAVRCGMYKTALLFVESSAMEGSRTSRRSSVVRAQESTDVLLDIFENIDDPDAYYGLRNNASLSNVLARLEYEKEGTKSLAFRGAQFDSHIRRRDPAANLDGQSLVGTLSSLGLSGLSHSLQNQQNHEGTTASVDTTFDNARRLEIWNLPAPSSTGNPSVTLYKAYQGCHQAIELLDAQKTIYNGLSQTMQNLIKRDVSTASIRRNLGTLATLTELDDVLNVSDPTDLESILTTFEERAQWMRRGR